MIKLHHFDQRVYGDFKVTFKSKECQFYFWLNASAILYNSKLKDLSEELNREVPIHFEEITEIEETQQIKEDKDKIDLVYPDEQAEIKNRKVEERDNRGEQIFEAANRRQLVKDHMEWQQSMTGNFYSDLKVQAKEDED